MEINLSESCLDFLSLFPMTAKLLSHKHPKISYFVYFMYLLIILKLKPKILKIKAVSLEYFKELVIQSNHKIDYTGDLYSCALLSISTLVALDINNKSWVKIRKIDSDNDMQSPLEMSEGYSLSIKMPPVGKSKENNTNDYYVQCLGVSNVPQDFVLYVVDVKLFNLSTFLNKTSSYCDLLSEVIIERTDLNFEPNIANSVVVCAVSSFQNKSGQDCEDILGEYFKKPRFLMNNEVFGVNILKESEHFKSRISLCGLEHVYFKVINIISESENQGSYVIKGLTNLYQSPSAHNYLPPKSTHFVEASGKVSGFEMNLCPNGLLKYFSELQIIIKPFLKKNYLVPKPMFLLYGAAGIGKKTTVRCVASSLGLNLLEINCFDFYGLNPSIAKGKFDQLFARIRRTVPCILYLENIEFLGRDQNYSESSRFIDIFDSSLKELWERKPNAYPLILIGSTRSEPSETVSAIARLFIHTIIFEAPNFEETVETLKWFAQKSNIVCSNKNLLKLAERVKGFVTGDLALLLQHIIRLQSQDVSNNQSDCRVLSEKYFDQGIAIMEDAYSETIGAAKIPSVKWEDVGGLLDLKEEIMLTLDLPLKHPELFASGLKRSGILFYGPPGTGKTLMAKAVATECRYNFLSVKGPELMNMYVGQSEKNVREVFERAREASPCIIFFDEIDSLAPSRGKNGDSGQVTDRVVSQLLAEMDGLNSNKGVFIIGATNRPDLVDPALLRPGRFDKLFYVGVCKDAQSKLSVFRALTRRFFLDQNVNFETIIGELPHEVTGADLYSICSNAWFSAAREAVNAKEKGSDVALPLKVTAENFKDAVQQFVPSLTAEDIDYYENLKSSYKVI